MQEGLRSPMAKRLDLEIVQDGVYATAELKETATGNFCHWFVSGIAASGLPSMLIDIAVPLISASRTDRLREADAFARKHIIPLALDLRVTPGAGESIPSLGVEERAQLFEAHMHHHFLQNNLGKLTLQRQTEALFKMATFLEVLTPVKLIAKFQGVGTGTVESRVQRGRANGNIPKASVVRAKKESLKKGS